MPDVINPIPKYGGDEGMSPQFVQWLSQVADSLNGLAGHNGTIPLSNHLVMGGSQVKGVGAPTDAGDAASNTFTEKNYSAAVLAPKFESNGSHPLRSVRRINDANQREQQSSYMNDLMSSVPNANLIFPLFTNSGSNVQVTIPSSLFTFADRSTLQLESRTDLLTKPAMYAISTISCTGNVVTIVLTTASPLVAGNIVNVAGVTPSSFNGSYQLTSSTGGGTTLTYQLSLGTLSGSGGDVESNSVWYYTVQKRNPMVHLLGPFPADTTQNRIQANFDNTQIVAVVVITNSGGQVEQSGGGGSPITGAPAAGAFFG